MAFKSNDLSVIAYVNGFTLWHYKSEDILASIYEAKYFNSIRKLINNGDIIIINGLDGVSIKCFKVDDKEVTLNRIKF